MKQIFDWMRGAILDKAFKIYDGTIAVDIHDIGELINEAEAKWEADCCEWKHLDRFSVMGHDIFFQIHNVRNYKFCPYCGKPIKISEVSNGMG